MTAGRGKTEALLPFAGGRGGPRLARGVRAGQWVFANAVMATGAAGRLAAELAVNPRPFSGLPRWHREADLMYRRAAEVLAAGGTDFAHAVRTDQYFPDWRAVPFLHAVRRDYCGSYVPPSTSILLPGLRVRGAAMSMEVMAVVPGRGADPAPVFPAALEVPATSSFAPVAVAGDHVFVAGFLAAWQPGDLGGIAPEAKVPEGHLWKGNRIQLEADYIVRRKLVPALEAAGSSLGSVVKAQVYLADIRDVPAFNLVWARHFGERVPATTFVPTSDPGFAIRDARCEINLVALTGSGRTRREAFGASPACCDGHPLAVRAGELLCFSGLVAADEKGCVARSRAARGGNARGIAAQMEYLIDLAEDACAKAGASLANVVRIQQFHTDLAEFDPACRVWAKRLRGLPLPLSAVLVPAPLLVPGCSVQLDLWVHAPARG
ncbi:MAG: RidA family protein [Burkholderiales bacterium]|nr:RidA family protein [Burkholderiales bacterium]